MKQSRQAWGRADGFAVCGFRATLALSFIGGTQRHERRLAFTLSETIVMTRLASGPRQSVEALSFFA
jgi:hypothetical protein